MYKARKVWYNITSIKLTNNYYYIMKNIISSIASEIHSFSTEAIDDLLIDLFHQELVIEDTFFAIELDEDFGSFRWSNEDYDNARYEAHNLSRKIEKLGYFGQNTWQRV